MNARTPSEACAFDEVVEVAAGFLPADDVGASAFLVAADEDGPVVEDVRKAEAFVGRGWVTGRLEVVVM
jgi:hypothetical protein